MRTIPVTAERAYQVEIGIDWQIALTDWIEGRNKVVLISSDKFPIKIDLPKIEIADGESGKSFYEIERVWRELGALGIGRQDLIIGIGGGAVTDLAGFAAATWMRGIDWLAIPTTVAGMVDAAIGGKTGINSDTGKNLVGSFHSPVGVLIDLSFLNTLSERDIAAGMAEVVKCGFISDPQILEILDKKVLKDIVHDEALQEELIFRAVSVKASVVSQDFKESFLREILNYGHTLGHAIEKHSNYNLRHGEAIAIGMCFAAELSKSKLGLDQSSVDLHRQILNSLKLPISYEKSAWKDLEGLMSTDKKSKSGQLRFVGIKEIGKCERLEGLTSEELRTHYERLSQ